VERCSLNSLGGLSASHGGADVRHSASHQVVASRTLHGAAQAQPMAVQILTYAGLVQAQTKPSSAVPTRRGGGNPVRMLFWAPPTILNPLGM
jgi:peptide/nickel transport system substrate-binding protein